MFHQTSDWQSAISYDLRALDIIRSIGNRRGEAYTLGNLAVAYDALGQPSTALDNLNHALRLFREERDGASEGRVLDVMGRITLAAGKPREALAYEQQALGLVKAAGDRRTEAEAQERLGEIWEQLDEPARASGCYEDSLSMFRAVGSRQGEAVCLRRMGLLKAHQGDTSGGLNLLDQALKIQSDIGLRDFVAATLSDMARLERDRGGLPAARIRIEAAINLVESLRTHISVQGLRTSYFASKNDYYGFYVQVLLELHSLNPSLGLDRLAFNAAERARARSLLDMLAEARQEAHTAAGKPLRDREHDLRRSLSLLSEQLLRTAKGPTSPAREADLRRRIDQDLAGLQQLESRILAGSYATPVQPEPLSVDDVQRTLLDQDTVLLNYSLGAGQSRLWVVSKTSFRTFLLPNRAFIESAVDRLTRVSGKREARDRYSSAAQSLTRILLRPATGMLGDKRLLIVGEGPLLSLSFATLPSPGGGAPMLASHEIVSLPSVSVLAMLRRKRAVPPAPKAALVLADPVFDELDPRVAVRNQPKDESPDTVLWPRLSFTREEAFAVSSSFRPDDVKTALGFNAAKSLLTGPEAAQYRILHLATHSLIDYQHPELSGIVLSMVDPRGRPIDGLLRLYEIYNLDLRADLVVLSACRSGSGPAIRGEGVIGLTRGFLYAGSTRVVTALWNVDDEATAELMKQFYRFQFGPAPMRPAAALRAAQLAVRSQKRWQAPYYWGAFILQGEWR